MVVDDGVDRPARGRSLTTPTIATSWAVITFGIGIIGLGRPSFWFDEAATVSAARRSPAQLLHLLRDVDAVHGLYYMIMLGWTRLFGTSETATRLPSLVGLTIAAAGFFVLVERMRERRTATIASAVFLVFPGISWVGGEARDYGFTLAAVIWAFVLLHRAVAGDRTRAWVGYCVLLILGFAFSILTVLALAAHVAWFVSAEPRPSWRKPVTAWLVSVAVASPLLAAALTQRAQLSFLHVSAAQLLPKVLLGQFFLGPRDSVHGLGVACAALLLIVSVTLSSVALIRSTGNVRRVAVCAAIWVAVPTVVLAAPVLVNVQFYQERYLAFTAPGLCLLVAEGVTLAPACPSQPWWCWSRAASPRWSRSGEWGRRPATTIALWRSWVRKRTSCSTPSRRLVESASRIQRPCHEPRTCCFEPAPMRAGHCGAAIEARVGT